MTDETDETAITRRTRWLQEYAIEHNLEPFIEHNVMEPCFWCGQPVDEDLNGDSFLRTEGAVWHTNNDDECWALYNKWLKDLS